MPALNTIIDAHRRERDLALQRKVVPRQLVGAVQQALPSGLVKVVIGPWSAGKFPLALSSNHPNAGALDVYILST